MEYTVRIHKGNSVTIINSEEGRNLLELLQCNSFDINSTCGGKGTCGKCSIRASGLNGKPSDREKELIGSKSISKGYRLACINTVYSDIDIFLDETSGKASIVEGGNRRTVALDTLIKKDLLELNSPSINDQCSDLDRVLSAAGKPGVSASLDLIRELPKTLRGNDFRVTMVYMKDELVCVEPGDTTGRLYGAAFDIGTTTIAAYLYDLSEGAKIDTYSMLNPQRKYGSDVLSRIDYTLNSKVSMDEMNRLIVDCINWILTHFVNRNKIEKSDIYTTVFAGNTTMMHFLMNINAGGIAVSPFIAATTRLHKFKAHELGIRINSHGYSVILPSVSAYIGADTVAAVLSSGMYEEEKVTLLIDFGTNGEIVLGNSSWLYACSTAAGPAFEGANIRDGIGGIEGAIDTISLSDGFKYTTIGGRKAAGICGSGVVDVVAEMLSAGIIDETGRIVSEDEMLCMSSHEFQSRIIDVDGLRSFLLLKSEETSTCSDIAITQKDIRELQNAKAAVAAGIKILVRHAGIGMGDIERVFLAGGFGSTINTASALKIGLIPSELEGRIESIGNAAGGGAIESLLSVKSLKRSEDIKGMINYIELSSSVEFVEEYVNCMLFCK